MWHLATAGANHTIRVWKMCVYMYTPLYCLFKTSLSHCFLLLPFLQCSPSWYDDSFYSSLPLSLLPSGPPFLPRPSLPSSLPPSLFPSAFHHFVEGYSDHTGRMAVLGHWRQLVGRHFHYSTVTDSSMRATNKLQPF